MEDIKIKIGKNYLLTYKRSQWKFIYNKECSWYDIEKYVSNKLIQKSIIIKSDLKSWIDYYITKKGNLVKIEEI